VCSSYVVLYFAYIIVCWHATNSLELTRLSCWCLQNHKRCTYRAPVRCVTKTWSVVLLNKKIHILLSQVYCVWQVVKTLTIISNNPVFWSSYQAPLFSIDYKPIFNVIEVFSKKYTIINFHEILSNGSLVVQCGRTNGRMKKRSDGQTGISKPITAFRVFSDALKN
jgi:hypothetical protein